MSQEGAEAHYFRADDERKCCVSGKSAMVDCWINSGAVRWQCFLYAHQTSDVAIKRKRMWKEVVYGVVLLAMAASLLLSVRGLRVLRRAWQSTRWPTACARISRAGILERHDEEGPRGYCPDVAYTFLVDGVVHDGERIAFGVEKLYGSHGFAHAYDHILCVGKEMPVHYHPAKPAISVLYPGITRNSFLPLLRAAACGILLALVLIVLPPAMGVAPMLAPLFNAL
ncbi:DUF3592 domain-containing protein [Massilia sp. CCM 8734]|uniref:DUF3592 domain-containing protein n=1 Tax=Massilia sp. CCM 8734 TaxID=2609283 RepID=UPI001420150B|nr:DUF3592 domain-containing protein [Massilia sp. CCM 8734]NHZ95903.1 DUF3592 domain-containing protein [Massilia sp. CCM 8734]